MPFTKTGPNEYTSPSGRKFTKKQVIAYYASNGTFNKAKSKEKHKKSRIESIANTRSQVIRMQRIRSLYDNK